MGEINLSPIRDKTINCLGDSITSTDYTIPTWWQIISHKTGAKFNNYGVSGTSIAKLPTTSSSGGAFIERMSKMNTAADGVIVMGGTNDGSALLGDWNSEDISTFYGALNSMLTYLKNTYSGKPILVCTPIKLGYSIPNDFMLNPLVELGDKVSTDKISLQLRAEAIKAKCKQHGLRCLDLWNTSGIDKNSNGVYYREDLTHPSAKGQERMASLIQAELERIFK